MKLLSIKVTIEPSRFLLIILYKLQVSHGYKFIGNKGKYFRYFRPRKLNEAISLGIEDARIQRSFLVDEYFLLSSILSLPFVDELLEIFKDTERSRKKKSRWKRKEKKRKVLITLVIKDEYIILHEIHRHIIHVIRSKSLSTRPRFPLSLFSRKKKKKKKRNAKIMRPVKNVKTPR